MFTILKTTVHKKNIPIPGVIFWYNDPSPARDVSLPDSILVREDLEAIHKNQRCPNMVFVSGFGKDILCIDGYLISSSVFQEWSGKTFQISRDLTEENAELANLSRKHGHPEHGLILKVKHISNHDKTEEEDLKNRIEIQKIEMDVLATLSERNDSVPGSSVVESWVAGLTLRYWQATATVFGFLDMSEEERRKVFEEKVYLPGAEEMETMSTSLWCWYPSCIPDSLTSFLKHMEGRSFGRDEASFAMSEIHPALGGFYIVKLLKSGTSRDQCEVEYMDKTNSVQQGYVQTGNSSNVAFTSAEWKSRTKVLCTLKQFIKHRQTSQHKVRMLNWGCTGMDNLQTMFFFPLRMIPNGMYGPVRSSTVPDDIQLFSKLSRSTKKLPQVVFKGIRCDAEENMSDLFDFGIVLNYSERNEETAEPFMKKQKT